MNRHLLSEQIRTSIASLDANPNPTPEQLVVIRQTHRELLCQVYDFAIDVEQAQVGFGGGGRKVVPMLPAPGIVSRLYLWLERGRRRPSAGMGELRAVS